MCTHRLKTELICTCVVVVDIIIVVIVLATYMCTDNVASQMPLVCCCSGRCKSLFVVHCAMVWCQAQDMDLDRLALGSDQIYFIFTVDNVTANQRNATQPDKNRNEARTVLTISDII